MKKKIILSLLASSVIAFAMTGCSQEEKITDVGIKEESQFNEEKESNENEDNDSKDDDSNSDDSKDDDSKDDNSNSDDSKGDNTNDIDTVEASLENPAKLGEWVKTFRYSAVDSEYHTCYFRITKIVRGSEAQEFVDKYNSEEHFTRFEELDDDDLEYCCYQYEAYYPEDFPQKDHGITSTDIDFDICNTEDHGSIANYIGLSSAYEINETPDEFFAGDTYNGMGVFAMVKEFDEFYIKNSVSVNDNRIELYIDPTK